MNTALMTPNSRVIRVALILLLLLPLLLASGEDAHAQRRKKGATKKSTPHKVERRRSTTKSPAKRATPSSPRSIDRAPVSVDQMPSALVEPYADLASEVMRDVSSPRGTVRRTSFFPDEVLTRPQLTLISRYKREESRIQPRPYAAVADHVPAPAPIYIDGNVGLYTTADFRAGIGGRSWPFDYLVHLGGSTTNGSVDNATRKGFELGASAGYVINDNAWIFSGGHMGADVSYTGTTYGLYAIPTHPDRVLESWSVGLNSSNTYLNDEFTLSGDYRGMTVDDGDGKSFRENALEGKATFGTPWMGLIVGGEAMLSLATFNGAGMPYSRLAGSIMLRRPTVTLQGGVAASMGENRDGSTSSRLVPTARFTLAPSEYFSFATELSGGIQQWRGDHAIAANPWIFPSTNADVRHEDQTLGYRGEVRIGSLESFSVHVQAAHAPYASYLGYAGSLDGRFSPSYQATTVNQISGETMIRFDANNSTTASVRYAESTIDATGARLPYVPKWIIEGTHSTRLSPLPLTLIASLKYIGDRNDGTGATLDPVTLLSIEGRYRLSSLLELTASVTNLLDRRYELWSGYQERGIYASAGMAIRYR